MSPRLRTFGMLASTTPSSVSSVRASVSALQGLYMCSSTSAKMIVSTLLGAMPMSANETSSSVLLMTRSMRPEAICAASARGSMPTTVELGPTLLDEGAGCAAIAADVEHESRRLDDQVDQSDRRVIRIEELHVGAARGIEELPDEFRRRRRIGARWVPWRIAPARPAPRRTATPTS